MEESSSLERFKWLSEFAPCFEVDASNIDILQEPHEFHSYLKVDSIESSLKKCPDLHVKVLLDYQRGLRGTGSSHGSSKSMLEPLLERFANRLSLFLYHTPNLRGLAKTFLSERANEIVGVQHMKIYIADDTLVISGANLSNDYFVNRQDRYIAIRNCASLCNLFESLVDTVNAHSFRVNKHGRLAFANSNPKCHPFEGDKKAFSASLREQVKRVLAKFEGQKQEATASTSKAFVYPLVQAGYCGIDMDERVSLEFFRRCASESLSAVKLAVGYFNLTEEYARVILDSSKCNYDILVSSPRANGFFESKGFSRHIPAIYSHFEETFFRAASNEGQRVRLFEYERDKWTFHGKGLWYYEPEKREPILTIVGSSNFGYRSVQRDLEAQLVIFSKDERFQKQLEQERQHVFDKSNLVSQQTFQCPTRSMPTWLRLFSRAFRSFF